VTSPPPFVSLRLPHHLAGLLAAAVAAVLVAGAAPARAADTVPDEVVVTPAAPATAASTAAAQPEPRTERTRPGESVPQAIRRLKRTRGVADAVPNYVARAAEAAPFYPNDPGRHTKAGNWQKVQWNMTGPYGVNAPQAWGNLIAAGRPGGRGVVVAVLDTGVAYTDRDGAHRSPDLAKGTFVRGYDFVDRDDLPTDRNGHGTHVASTIAEATNNGIALTGLAYGAKIMPVRVLDDQGEGDATTIARGVRYAADHGAQVINLSLEFPDDGYGNELRPSDIPQLMSALRHAYKKRVLVVAATGNEGRTAVDYPAKAPNVLGVGATTEHGCLSAFSNRGEGQDIVAPGGGRDARFSETNCTSATRGRDITQMTIDQVGSWQFGLPGGYEGTSMATPHVSATAALVIASGVIGAKPTPLALTRHLQKTARDLGAPGYDTRYGAGLVDAAAATAPTTTSAAPNSGATPPTSSG
jgi:serine protease